MSALQVLADAESACEELQRAASGLEGRLAELDHWSTEAMDRYQHPRDKRHSGRSAFESAAKVSKPTLLTLSQMIHAS